MSTVDITALSYATAAIVVYYTFLFALGRVKTGRREIDIAAWPLLVIVVPARNEERVIERTVRCALSRFYPGTLRVVVVNDESNDLTGDVARRAAADDPRVWVLEREPGTGGRGKSDTLNFAFRAIRGLLDAQHEWLGGASAEDVIVCVVDADGHLSETALIDGVRTVCQEGVGAAQIGVHIRNCREHLVARLQDIEFVGFSHMVQAARDHLGSVGLGGNGQFVRLSALASLGTEPWRSSALTEDLDLGVRLQLAGWRLRFCPTAWVEQEGLTRLRPLLRQRTRWTQGHYQCWRYAPRVAAARQLRLRQRLDTLAYLLLVILVVLVTTTAIAHLFSVFGVLTVTDSFLTWMGYGFGYRAATLLLSWLPVVLLLITYQRHAQYPLRRWELPAYCVFFAVFVYIWAIATARAWIRLALRRTSWVKSPRLEEIPATSDLIGAATP